MTKTRILVVAADAKLRATVARMLLQAGYAVELAENFKRAREVMAQESLGLAIVAPPMVGPGATEFAREIKDRVNRVILITQSGDESSRELPVKASSRVTSPFTEQDLLASVKSELSASTPTAQEVPAIVSAEGERNWPKLLKFESFTLDAEGRSCLDAAGRELMLTRAEFALLAAFARQPGRVLSRDELTYVVAGRAAEPEDRSVDVLISRLRRKIEPDPKTPRIILTVPGEGYKFTGRPEVVEIADGGTAVSSAAQPAVQMNGAAEQRDIASSYDKARLVRISVAGAIVLLAAATGWSVWHFRAATAPGQSASEQGHRAVVYKRMLTAMHDGRFNWRTVERLAIEAGVNEEEAREILAEHPDEVAFGKSHDGKLLARLAAQRPPEVMKPSE